ncbi:MAG TPA: hypothetical protein PKC39_12710 [Ferruginibacter sp.]|nr:hypothetical protein [Ferruginibacter sp.]
MLYSLAHAQSRRICVIGSSTAYGYFPPPSPAYPADSGWVGRLNNYCQSYMNVDTVFNLAKLGRDCYSAMPTGYVPPEDENNPDPTSNISRAIAMSPKPDVIIVNYPTNNYERISNAAIIECYQVIMDSAMANGIRCYIATSQPRNSFNYAGRLKLKALRDTIMEVFGQYAIDFFTPLADEETLKIQSCYDLGDNIHINPQGHEALAMQVIAKNLFVTVLPVRFEYFTAKAQQGKTVLNWRSACDGCIIKQFMIERSINGRDFEKAGLLNANPLATPTVNYQFADPSPNNSGFYYRIAAYSSDGKTTLSPVVYVAAALQPFKIAPAFPSPASNTVQVPLQFAQRMLLDVIVSDVQGKILKRKKIDASGNLFYREDISNWAPGNYYIRFSNALISHVVPFVKQ